MLKLNANKCKTVSYGRNVSTDYTYYLNGTVLARDNFIKDLRVIFDDHLNFQRHCYEKNKQSLQHVRHNKQKF